MPEGWRPPGRVAGRRPPRIPRRLSRCLHVPLAQREVIHPGDRRRGGDRRVWRRHDHGAARWRNGPARPGARPAGRRPARPAPGRSRPACPAAARCAAGTAPTRPRPARRTSPSGTRAPGSGTGAPTARSAPAGHRPRHRPPPAHTRHEPARTPPRMPGTAPAPPGSTPDHHRVPGVLHLRYPQPAKVREQHEQQLLALPGNLLDTAGGGGRPVGRHGRLRRQRGSRGERSWQTSASYRSLVARSR